VSISVSRLFKKARRNASAAKAPWTLAPIMRPSAEITPSSGGQAVLPETGTICAGSAFM